jgi:chlorobactene glucosyltransferase
MFERIMTDFWLQHQVSLIVFIVILIVIAISNLLTWRRFKLGRYPESKERPKVTVMVPVRNEEENIEVCVRSLLAQEYSDLEVIVLDDHSTDRTWKLLQEFRNDKRLTLMKGKDLPQDWFGKHWACHQMTNLARGELLAFTDADTRHHPDSIRSAVDAFISEDADLLTAIPFEEAKTFGENLMVPVLPFAILSFLPLSVAHNVRWPAYSATVGQFMMFKRETFEAIGGYPAIKHKQVDDMALGQRIKRMGYRWRLYDGQDRISCRMYDNFDDAFHGFGKTIFSAFERKIIPFLFVWLWLFCVFTEPLVVAGIRIAGGPISDLSLYIAITTILISLVLWAINVVKFRFRWWVVFLYPVVFTVTWVMSVYAVRLAASGKATWKGRTLYKRR